MFKQNFLLLKCWNKKKKKKKSLQGMKKEPSYYLVSRLQCMSNTCQWHHVSIYDKLLQWSERPLRHREQVGQQLHAPHLCLAFAREHALSRDDALGKLAPCLDVSAFIQLKAITLFIRLSTSEVFCFQRNSIGIMLELRLSFVLADLLLISSWLLLIGKNFI